MCESLDDFEYYPALTGGIYDYKNMMNILNKIKYITDDDKAKIYYRKIYQDIYDDYTVNYEQCQYIDIVKSMIEYNENGLYAGIINKIQELLIFKETYHKVKTSKMEQMLLQLVNETNYKKLSLLYTSPSGDVSILYISELERLINCEFYIENHHISRLIKNIRYYIKGQYYCGVAIMEILQKELLRVNGILFKIELNIRNRNRIILPHIKTSYIIILDCYKIKQDSIVKQMDKIDKELKKLKYKRDSIIHNNNNNIIHDIDICKPFM